MPYSYNLRYDSNTVEYEISCFWAILGIEKKLSVMRAYSVVDTLVYMQIYVRWFRKSRVRTALSTPLIPTVSASGLRPRNQQWLSTDLRGTYKSARDKKAPSTQSGSAHDARQVLGCRFKRPWRARNSCTTNSMSAERSTDFTLPPDGVERGRINH